MNADSADDREGWTEAICEAVAELGNGETEIIPSRVAKVSATTGSDITVDAHVAAAMASGASSVVLHSGILRKSPSKVTAVDQRSTWKVRWFSLSDDAISYFVDVDEQLLKGTIKLSDVLRIQPSVLSLRYDFVFALHTRQTDSRSEKGRSYFLAADSEEDRRVWVDALTIELNKVVYNFRCTVLCTREQDFLKINV